MIDFEAKRKKAAEMTKMQTAGLKIDFAKVASRNQYIPPAKSALSLVTPKERVEAPSPRQVGESLFPNSPFLREQPNKNSLEVLGNMHGRTEIKPEPSLLERIGKTFSGAGKNYVGSYLNAADISTPWASENTGGIDPFLSPARQKAAEEAPAIKEVTYNAADKLMSSGSIDTERAKEGAGALGRLAVDVGTGGLQLLGDLGIAAATGGSSIIPMAVRSFGSGAKQAEQEGATKGEQFAYGGLSATTSALVGKLSNVGSVLTKAYGKGALDGVMQKGLSGAINKAIKNGVVSDRIATALTAGLGEGLEESIESILDPLYKKIAYDPDAEWNAEDILYDGLVGAIIGTLAGGVGGNVKSQGDTQNAVQTSSELLQNTQDIAQEGIQAPTAAQGVAGGEVTPSTWETVQSGNNALSDYVDHAISKSRFVENPLIVAETVDNFEIGEVSEKLSTDIMANYGVDIDGKVHVLNDNDIRHIFNRHGPHTNEKYPVTAADIKAIPDIIENYDNVYYVPRKDGKSGLIYQKRHNGTTYYVEQIVGKDNVLQNKQIIKTSTGTIPDIEGLAQAVEAKRNTNPAPDKAAAAVPRMYVQDVKGSASIDNIPQSPENINTISPQNATLPDGMGAASQGFDPYTQAIEEYGVIPDGENPVRPADVPAQLTDDTKVSRGARTAMEAEATTDEAYNAIGDAVMSGKFSYLPITDNAAKGAAEQRIKDKGWDAAARDWTAEARRGKGDKNLVVLGQTLYNNAVNSGNVEAGIDILVDLVKMSRTNAQALQANRVLKQLSPEYQLYALQRSAQSLSDELSTKLSKKGIDGITINKDLAQEYLDAKTDAERNLVMESLKDDIAAQVPPTWMDKWNAWRYLSMLGNPRTHIRNIVGNAGFVPVRMVKNVVATGLERTFGISSKTKSVLTLKDKPLIERAFGDYNEVSEQIMSLGKMDNFTGDIDSRRRIFKSSALEGTRNFNTKALDVEDVWFAKPAYANALAGWYKANGITADALAGGKVSQDTIDKARAYAIREAQRATYRDSNEFSDWVSKLGRGYTGTNKVAKAANVLVEGVLPFKRTPANILTRAVEYSPVGLTKGLTNDLIQVHKGSMEAWQAIDNISAGLTGTGLLGLGAYLASMGLLSGGASDDENERELDNLTGRQNYALNIGGKSITLDWLAPEALPLFVGVELYNAATDKSKDGLSLMTFLDKLSGITEPMFEMSMLQGVNDLFDSIKYSDKNSLVGVAATSAANYLSQGLPTIFGQLERSFEPERKSTYTDPNSGMPTSLQYMLGKTSGKVPLWEYQQEPYRDSFGNTQSNGSLAYRLANNLLNPAYVRNINDNEVTNELRRLNDENYLEKAPSAPPKSFDYGGEKHKLSANEYSQFQETSGKKSFDLMSALLKDSEYKRANDEKRAALMKQLLGYSSDCAKREYIGSRYKSSSYEKTHEAEQAGISPIDYFAFKSNLKDIDDNDSPTQLEKAQAIMPLDLATQYKGSLWEIQNGEPSDKNPFTGALAQKGLAPEKCIDIMDAYNRIDKAMENYVKHEGGAGAAQVQAAYFNQWLSRTGYNSSEIGAITEVFKTWQMIPIDKPSKKATAFVAQNPMP